MQTESNWYVGLRAEALAKVYLTRRDDLIISEQQQGAGTLDFLLKITQDGKYSGRMFGIEVKATASSSDLIQEQEFFKVKNKKYNFNISFFKDLPFPMCLFFFTVDNDKGYYKWILEPIIKDHNNVALKINENEELTLLNDEEIDNIITIVNSWYDHKSNLIKL